MTKIQNKILSVTGVWVVKNRVPGLANIGRTQGLKIMKDMIQDKILETRKEGRTTWVKTNFENTKSVEHEFSHTFQDNMLSQAIEFIKKHKKPLFRETKKKTSFEQPTLGDDGKTWSVEMVTSTEKVFVPRTKSIKRDLDGWAFYTDNLIVRIAREEYGVAFGITDELVSEKWLGDYRTTLKKHVTKLLDTFPEEKSQIKRYFQSSVRQFSFKI